MNCQKCGKTIADGGKFCEFCGSEVENFENNSQSKKASGLQTVALIMGILGFFIPLITSVLAIVFSAITLKEKPNGKAIAGLALGIVSLLMIPIQKTFLLPVEGVNKNKEVGF